MNEVKERENMGKMDSFPRFTLELQSFTYTDQEKVQLLKIINESVSITSECIEI